jgi:serine protease Do
MARWSLAFVCLVVGGLAGVLVTGQVLQGQAPNPPAVPKEVTSYRDVVKQVLPAVVSIEARAKPVSKSSKQQTPPRRRPRSDDQPQIPEEFRRFFEEFNGRQLEIPDETPQLGFGSGVIVDSKGVILTNYHVVAGADQVEVQLKDGRKFTSKDIHADRKTDLAIVRIEVKSPLPALQLGDSDAMEIGDRVLAVGAPFGLTGSVTAGIVSAKGRDRMNMNLYEDFLQTDAAINPGNSGGPLVSLDGTVIGINTAIKSRTGGSQGVGFAISSNLAKNIMQQLLKDGTVHRGYLGVQIRDLEPEVAARLGVKDPNGVLVSQVFDGAPAAKAGLQPGDVVVSVGGKPVKDGRELQRVVASLPLRKPVDVTVVRDGKSQVVPVTIEEQPDDYGTARVPVRQPPRGGSESVNLDKIGVEVADLTPEMADQFGYKEKQTGALVTQVEPGSPAQQAGLRRGMLITRVDKKSVTSAAAAREALEKGALDKGVLVQVQSPQGATDFLVLKVKAETSNK